MFGLLDVDKPAGITSRDVVNRVQRVVRPLKVGHAGTLDPLATGVLVIAIGPATRLIEYIQRMPKVYQGTFLLGRTSDTEDVEGEVIKLSDAAIPSRVAIEAAIPRFVGSIAQRPPAYSALKVGGRRAYKMARRGDTFELAPRSVEIHAIEMVRYDYPGLELLVRCGSGTYIRSLGRDLAEAIGTGAIMSKLRRLAVGPFLSNDAATGDKLDFTAIQSRLLSPLLAVGEMPRITLEDDEMGHVAQGRPIPNRWGATSAEIAAVTAQGTLAAILTTAADGMIRPEKCFLPT